MIHSEAFINSRESDLDVKKLNPDVIISLKDILDQLPLSETSFTKHVTTVYYYLKMQFAQLCVVCSLFNESSCSLFFNWTVEKC